VAKPIAALGGFDLAGRHEGANVGPSTSLNIGFVSFRFSGTDGVSLETAKWAEVLEAMGHKCFYFAGECDRPENRSMVVAEAHFQHLDVKPHHERFWTTTERTHDDSQWIRDWTALLYKHVRRFVEEFALDLLIPQNVFSYPLNIPLTLATTELIAETSIPTIAHHHDFYWERKPFLVNSAWDYLTMAFPPTLPSIEHVVINTSARHQLAARKGLAATVIPNVMNFEQPPPQPDDYCRDIRDTLGLDDDERLLLQPTRVVQRKGIEHAIELTSRLGLKARLVITHSTADDEVGYVARVKEFAELLGVKPLFCSDIFDEKRRRTADGRKVYSLWDIYPFADIVTYPSLVEGFGNAFLEAVYFKKPIVVNSYTIYETDIRTKGFKVIVFDDFITEATVRQTLDELNDPELSRERCEHNYQLALKYFSYAMLRHELSVLLSQIFGVEHR
jgi:glycosyltransferase involved in cell wall biosynthesis